MSVQLADVRRSPRLEELFIAVDFITIPQCMDSVVCGSAGFMSRGMLIRHGMMDNSSSHGFCPL